MKRIFAEKKKDFDSDDSDNFKKSRSQIKTHTSDSLKDLFLNDK